MFRFWRGRVKGGVSKQRRQVGGLANQSEQHFEQYFFKRFSRLGKVRRFMIGWISLVAILIFGVMLQTFGLTRYYQTVQPVDGGIYNEGILGTFSNANPIYATNEVDSSVSRLLFSGLFTHNEKNELAGDLATGYTYDGKTNTYTVGLKRGITWQDGQPFTSQDVVFTYKLIQNPDTQSPLQSSWRGIEVAAPNANTVTFKLPNPLVSFPYTLTNGIVPEHVLSKVKPAEMRTADFNTTKPVGTGPFVWQAIEVSGREPSKAQERIALSPFANYRAGEPKLQEFVVHAYADKQQLVDEFKSGRLTAVSGLDSTPNDLNGGTLEEHNFTLTAGTYVFFKTTAGVLAEQAVRQSLVQGSNVPQILSKLNFPTRPVREALLSNQIGYDPSLVQTKYDLAAAKARLDSAGWVPASNGIRQKAGKPLTFALTTAEGSAAQVVGRELATQWKELGVKLDVRAQSSQDFQNSLNYHDYDAVLNGISIGLDPDVYVYWDSSQADVRSANRLNLSEYKNSEADVALEAGRTRFDPELRAVKYKPFLQAWQKDAPALGLYQPRVLYITATSVKGLDEHQVNTATDRYSNVQNWQIREARVTNGE